MNVPGAVYNEAARQRDLFRASIDLAVPKLRHVIHTQDIPFAARLLIEDAIGDLTRGTS